MRLQEYFSYPMQCCHVGIKLLGMDGRIDMVQTRCHR